MYKEQLLIGELYKPVGLAPLASVFAGSTIFPSRGGSTFWALRPTTFPAGKKLPTKNHFPSRARARPIPTSQLAFHTVWVKWPTKSQNRTILYAGGLKKYSEAQALRFPAHQISYVTDWVRDFYRATACNATNGIAVAILSVCPSVRLSVRQMRVLWEN